jgi:hypothetical protein
VAKTVELEVGVATAVRILADAGLYNRKTGQPIKTRIVRRWAQVGKLEARQLEDSRSGAYMFRPSVLVKFAQEYRIPKIWAPYASDERKVS